VGPTRVSSGVGEAGIEEMLRDHGSAEPSASASGEFSNVVSGADGRPVGPISAEKSSRTRTILVVEDEDLLRNAVVKGLRNRGFTVLEACDVPSALALIRSDTNKIDIALLDLMLRGISSREICEEVQSTRPGLKVILTSAHSEQTAVACFSGLRIELFLRKPFRLADLVTSLQDALSS